MTEATPAENDGLDPTDAHRLRLVQLELLEAFQSFCVENNLPYFAIAGTALGAVRHEGFIPWDDDLDLAMPREAFDALVATAPQALDERFFLQHPSTDRMFPLPMAKLRRNDSRFVEDAVKAADMHHGIFIDIFPIDRKPVGAAAQKLHYACINTLSRLARGKSGYEFGSRTLLARLVARGLRTLLLLLPMRMITRAHEACLRLFNKGRGPLTIAGGTYGYTREWFDPQWLSKTVMTKFEDQQVPIFAENETYLTQLYGDFWTLPAEAARRSPHRVIALEFPTTS